MASIKITGFQGTVPKLSPELLPDTSAQITSECKLYSGDLIPYPNPVAVAAINRPGTIETLYALRNPDTDELVWLSWTSNVSIVTPAADELNEQRFYYAGDGKPKVSTYALATNGAEPYPTANGYYDLGLPLPTQKPTTNALAFSAITGVTRYRDRANNAVITTGSAHNLKNGATVSMTGFADTSFNTIAEVSVVSPTVFTYYSVGPEVGSAYDGSAVVDLGSQFKSRNYLYTWYTPWTEESIGSEPSTTLFIKEGIVVLVSSIPTTPPAGNNFIRGVRLYRTVAGTTESEYFRLATLWYPNTVARVSRTSNVSKITMVYPHNLLEKDRFKINGCSNPSFDIVDGVVTNIINQYTFEYAQTAAPVTDTAATGTLYYDVSEGTDFAARYWGDPAAGANQWVFRDDFNYRSLSNVLETNEYSPPPEDLKGIVVIQNNFMAGFSGNDLYFSEPNRFHAWPDAYKRSFESQIVGLAAIGGTLLVLTESFPYIVDGSDPAILTQSKLSSRYPCLNGKSIVATNFGVFYSTHDGLAVFSPSAGAQLVTRNIHSSDTWNSTFDPATLVGVLYKDTYFASHTTGSIIFDPGDKGNPSFVSSSFRFTSAWYDEQNNALYGVYNSTVYRWDDTSQSNNTLVWKSKVFKTAGFLNLGAARIIADYVGTYNTEIWDLDDDLWQAAAYTWSSESPIIFKLYVDKSLLFTKLVSSNDVFRLPQGYKSDTFEVQVESTARVRSIQLGETPTSLRQV